MARFVAGRSLIAARDVQFLKIIRAAGTLLLPACLCSFINLCCMFEEQIYPNGYPETIASCALRVI